MSDFDIHVWPWPIYIIKILEAEAIAIQDEAPDIGCIEP
jgi:hypothetical protein